MRLHTTQRPPGTVPIGALLLVPLLFLPFGAWVIEQQIIELGVCGLRQALGIPCMSCGATRATFALFDGNVGAAFATQPLIISLYVIVGIWGLASLWTFLRDRKLVLDMTRVEDIAFKISLVVLPLLNWAYLIWQDI